MNLLLQVQCLETAILRTGTWTPFALTARGWSLPRWHSLEPTLQQLLPGQWRTYSLSILPCQCTEGPPLTLTRETKWTTLSWSVWGKRDRRWWCSETVSDRRWPISCRSLLWKRVGCEDQAPAVAGRPDSHVGHSRDRTSTATKEGSKSTRFRRCHASQASVDASISKWTDWRYSVESRLTKFLTTFHMTVIASSTPQVVFNHHQNNSLVAITITLAQIMWTPHDNTAMSVM